MSNFITNAMGKVQDLASVVGDTLEALGPATKTLVSDLGQIKHEAGEELGPLIRGLGQELGKTGMDAARATGETVGATAGAVGNAAIAVADVITENPGKPWPSLVSLLRWWQLPAQPSLQHQLSAQLSA